MVFGALSVLALSLPARRVVSAQQGDMARFAIFWRGDRIGFENVTVSSTPSGWHIVSTGSQLAPLDFALTRFDVTYSSDWHPQTLSLESVLKGQIMTLTSTFAGAVATNDQLLGGQKVRTTRPVSPGTIVLPTNCYGAFEALAAQLRNAAAGTRLPVYVAPTGETMVTVDRVTPVQMITLSGTLSMREVDLSLAGSTPLVIKLTVDARGRLARITIPVASIVVARDDIASVMTREQTAGNPGDEDVYIPALGFTIAATLTHPAKAAGRLPAVVLVAGAGPENRDEIASGVPIFSQFAGAIADAGFVALRYDKRGVGQSGGRAENASITDFAADLSGIVAWLRNRKDIDPNRIVLAAYGEGGAVALTAAVRDKKIGGLALLGVSGQKGQDLVVWQQQHVLSKSGEPDTDKQAKIALQQRIINAAIKGTGWEGVPPTIRRQADSPWFTSWLLFDPAKAIKELKRPILILQGALDTTIPPDAANYLEQLGRARKNTPASATRKIVLTGLNHLFVPARTGEPEEYPALDAKAISGDAKSALTLWLKEELPPKK